MKDYNWRRKLKQTNKGCNKSIPVLLEQGEIHSDENARNNLWLFVDKISQNEMLFWYCYCLTYENIVWYILHPIYSWFCFLQYKWENIFSHITTAPGDLVITDLYRTTCRSVTEIKFLEQFRWQMKGHINQTKQKQNTGFSCFVLCVLKLDIFDFCSNFSMSNW